MAVQTAISWCDSTFNPWIGCTKVSPACDHCYAERAMATRLKSVQWGAGQPRKRTTPAYWRAPLRWNATRFMQCGACGWRGECAAELIGCGACGSITEMHDARRRVFCASLADVFDTEVNQQWRDDLMGLIWSTPNLDWLLLTKRIGNVQRMLDELSGRELQHGERMVLPRNAWIGATVVNQDEADRDIPKLLALPARVRFLSIEPMLEGLWLRKWLRPSCNLHGGLVAADGLCDVCIGRGLWSLPAHPRPSADARLLPGIDWVICGGESGPHARPMNPDWVRSLRDQCAAAGVPFHFKQWGEWLPADDDACMGIPSAKLMYEDGCQYEDGIQRPVQLYGRVGKKASGRLLDGRTWDGFPP